MHRTRLGTRGYITRSTLKEFYEVRFILVIHLPGAESETVEHKYRRFKFHKVASMAVQPDPQNG
jgi:hypothetical protein